MGVVGTDLAHRTHYKKRGRQGKEFVVKGYTTQKIHVVLDDTSDEELPQKVKYATIVQEEPFVPDDVELFSKEVVQ